jgi:hypothetical protein
VVVEAEVLHHSMLERLVVLVEVVWVDQVVVEVLEEQELRVREMLEVVVHQRLLEEAVPVVVVQRLEEIQHLIRAEQVAQEQQLQYLEVQQFMAEVAEVVLR